MTTPAITLEALPAGYGDCLLISYPVGRSTWRMLLDTGPDETYPALKAWLSYDPTGRASVTSTCSSSPTSTTTTSAEWPSC